MSRQTSDGRRRRRRTRTTRSAADEITMKKVLLFRKEPNAAPVFVTLTRIKKSGITVRPGPSGLMNRRTSCFVHLIQRVEREREKEDEFHIFPPFLSVEQSRDISIASFNGGSLDSVPLRSTALGMTEKDHRAAFPEL